MRAMVPPAIRRQILEARREALKARFAQIRGIGAGIMNMSPLSNMDTKKTLQKMPEAIPAANFDDAQAAHSLATHAKRFEQHQFLLGLHCFWIKSRIPYGEFGPWLKKHLPDLCRTDGDCPKPKRALSEAMKFCTDAAERAGFTIGGLLENLDKIQFPTKVGNCHAGETLLLTDGELPEEAAALKEQLLKGIQLQLDFENGEKAARAAGGTAKKLTPTEQHAELVKNLDAQAMAAIGGLEILLAMKDVDFVLVEPVKRNALDGLCKQMRAKVKKFRKQK